MLCFLSYLRLIVLIIPQMTRNKYPLGVRLNNPFNIRYTSHNKWLGQIGNVNGFCKFIQPWYGVRAFSIIYRVYLRTGSNTIAGFIRSYAPSAENDTNSYIRSVCSFMGRHPDYRLVLTDFRNFAHACCHVELGKYHQLYYNLIEEYNI